MLEKVHFPNLNGIRFIAAFLVIIHHIEQLKLSVGLPSYWRIPFIEVVGKLGVVAFFVLSGFLITYLLLTEEAVTGTIGVRNFYVRRILRIWPLYYAIIGLGFFFWPNVLPPELYSQSIVTSFYTALLLYVFFLPNLAVPMFGPMQCVSHTWSIGTEEQFYLIWPLILKTFRKNRLFVLAIVIVAYLTGRLVLKYSSLPMLAAFWGNFNIDCMAIGAMFAVLLFQRSAYLKFLLNNYAFYTTLVITLVLMGFGIHIPGLHYEFYSVLFGIIILNFAANRSSGLSLENPVIDYLGNISYGLYMYHPTAIILSLLFAKSLSIGSNFLIYPLCLAATFIMAALSYRYMESRFLRFKERFSTVKT